ncbi:hypothetical protein H696_02156 [Fonticula alba]|uniref:DNA-directed RNA polymerase subunit n=1 Tax=Fonticula alba TaxID=691883 RepID=A0A058ZAA6_FONAL|nr:hypothetical protein H696_02156 [Fonticula alba]KCV71205.1 hypothetical protein H696_02156 [Fonticula alba]|eukprot:XP_009494328.1 hypothetical protein H696_02156 [Fonticula alba]
MEEPSPAPRKSVKAVQFGLFSPQEISDMSVCCIQHAELYDPATGAPIHGGLFDPRLGPDSQDHQCATCEMTTECPGHFGHLDLVRPVFHLGFKSKLMRVLRSVCGSCSALLVKKDDPACKDILARFTGRHRLQRVSDLAKTRRKCDACEQYQRLFKYDKMSFGFMYTSKKQVSAGDEGDEAAGASHGHNQHDMLTPEIAMRIMKNITDEDIDALGFDPVHARPEWMVIEKLPIPPPQVRPSVAVEGTKKSNDDLVFALREIIKRNNMIANTQQSERDRAKMLINLQYYIKSYMDNHQDPKFNLKTGRPIKAITQRLKGKEGRIRHNLMGKRVNFSARTVIGPDPSLALDQVGVPRSIAANLTFPERVTPLNHEELTRLVQAGPQAYPGARYVTSANGPRRDLARVHDTSAVQLQYGDIVDRYIRDDDLVLFNRQPSLHKMSMMGHRVKVMPFSTFRLNLSVTTPYNADFDGDEMNLHVPQTIEARTELLKLAMVPTQIVSPQANKPVMGIVQDSLLAVNLFSRRDCFLEKHLVMNLLMWFPHWKGVVPIPAILKPKPLWTGKQLLSMIIPPDISLSTNHSTHNEEEDADPITQHLTPGDTRVVIDNSVLLSGMVCKKTVGSAQGGLIHVICIEYSNKPNVAAEFMTNIQYIVNNWLLFHGFSVGIGDGMIPQSAVDKITSTIRTARVKVIGEINNAIHGDLKEGRGMTIRDTLEGLANAELSMVRSEAGKISLKYLQPFNNFRAMVDAGSKGSSINISQISACVGQQNVEGKRIPFGFRDRTLPHFTKDDFSADSRGFVESSYIEGLNPMEFFFHTMGGREGLIDTAVKTAETGYIQRRLIKAMEDIMVRYDGTVRNSLGEVIQFCYGEDGLNAQFVEHQKLDLMSLTNEEFAGRYRINLLQDPLFKAANNYVSNTVSQFVMANIKTVQDALTTEYNQLLEDRATLQEFIFPRLREDKCYLPVNVLRLIRHSRRMRQHNDTLICDLSPVQIVEEVANLCDRIVVISGDDPISRTANRNATMLFRILIRQYLSVRRVVAEFRFDRSSFQWVIHQIESRFRDSIIHPGEAVGTIAAQSIGEPATQMTLNTFHSAGIGAKNITLGVPRLRELIDVARSIKTPSMSIMLVDEFNHSEKQAHKALAAIEHTTLAKVTHKSQVIYDPDQANASVVEADDDFIQLFFATENVDPASLSPWVLRLELDRSAMEAKRCSMDEVAGKIAEHLVPASDFVLMHSHDNYEKLVLRISIRNTSDSMDQNFPGDKILIQYERKLLSKVVLKGIDKIKQVKIDKIQNPSITVDGGLTPSGPAENYLVTTGSNMRDVLSSEFVEFRNTVTNNIVETCEVLGIEAARQTLLLELKRVIEFDGNYVNYHHLGLLCDVMTYRGFLMPINRHGFNRNSTGALMRSSYEETVDVLLEAAAHAEIDRMQGVSENILLGQLSPVGTGVFDVMLDEDKLREAIPLSSVVTGETSYSSSSSSSY